jgi:5-methyltetrahydrofolate--homocysteine methyltransferase
VKIAPRYAESVVHVNDASRAVGRRLVAARRGPQARARRRQPRAAGALRFVHEGRRERPLLPLEQRARTASRSRGPGRLPDARVPGRARAPDVTGRELVPFIDWTFFFAAWELKGKFPAILDHPERGPPRASCTRTGARCSTGSSASAAHAARVYGFWPAASDGDDSCCSATRRAQRERALPDAAPAGPQPDGKPNLCLADFVGADRSGIADHIGALRSPRASRPTTSRARFEKDLDDYNAIMVKALADRLAEAFAEYLHARARRDGATAPSEQLSNEELIGRALPRHPPRVRLSPLPRSHAQGRCSRCSTRPAQGIDLTESYAMRPAASVSGLYFAHPAARYFTVGRIDRDQVADYAARTDISQREVERWLAPNLGYDPE